MSLIIEESSFVPAVEKSEAAFTSWNGHNISTEESAVDSKIREFKALLNEDWMQGASWAWLPGCVVLLTIGAQVGAPIILIPSLMGCVAAAYRIFKGDDENKKQLLKSFDELNLMVGNHYSECLPFIDTVLGIPIGLKAPRDMKTRLEFLRSIYFTRGLFNNLLAVISTVGAVFGTWKYLDFSFPPALTAGTWEAFVKNGLPLGGSLLIPALIFIRWPAGIYTDEKMIAVGNSEEKFFKDLTIALKKSRLPH